MSRNVSFHEQTNKCIGQLYKSFPSNNKNLHYIKSLDICVHWLFALLGKCDIMCTKSI